jgi:class 3 adenylate cyclase
MKLRTKLFFFNVVIVLFVCLILYLVPEWETKIHIGQLDQQFQLQFQQARQQQQQHYLSWLQEELDTVKDEINATLYVVNNYPPLYNAFAPAPGAKIAENLSQAALLMAHSNEVSFIQNTQQGELASLITLSEAIRYDVRKVLFGQSNVAWVLVNVPQTEGAPFVQEAYIGILFNGLFAVSPEGELTSSTQYPQHEAGIRMMYDPLEFIQQPPEFLTQTQLETEVLGRMTDSEMKNQIISFTQQVKEAYNYLKPIADKLDISDPVKLRRALAQAVVHHQIPVQSSSTPPPVPSSSGNIENISSPLGDIVRRANEIDMIFQLGLILDISEVLLGGIAPVGMADIEFQSDFGHALFLQDVIRTSPMFADTQYYAQHRPPPHALPIATSFDLLSPDLVGKLTVVNTMQLTNAPNSSAPLEGYLTVGMTMRNIGSWLALATGESTVMVYREQAIGAFDADSTVPNEELRKAFPVATALSQHESTGVVSFNDESYFYMKYQPVPEWDLYFFNMVDVKQALAFNQQFLDKSKAVIQAISHHIIFYALAVFVVGMAISEVIARRISKPITHLAKVTEKVLKGRYDQIEIPKTSPSSNDEVSILTRSFGTMVKGLQDRERIRDILNKVVSREIAEEILKGNVHLGGDVHEVTVFFADIRGFTTITQDLPPEQVIAFLNEYMTRMTEIIEEHGGVIDKYVGDEIMALYGAPIPHQYSALQAIVSALLMIEKLNAWNKERHEKGAFPFEVGFGVNHGPVLAGNMGTELRLNYTVLGANVNLAARLCSEAAGMEILVTKSVLDQPKVADVVAFEEVSAIWLKGFTHPTTVYRVTGFKPGVKVEELGRDLKIF